MRKIRKRDLNNVLKLLGWGWFLTTCACSIATSSPISPVENGTESSPSDVFQVLIPAPVDQNAQLGLLYENKQGQIIMEYDLGRTMGDRAFFYNGHPLYGLDDLESYNLANVPHALEKFASMHGLRPLESTYLGWARYETAMLRVTVLDAPKCQWPFNAVLEVSRENRTGLKVMFFRKRPEPANSKYNVWCERGPGEVQLTTHYENLPPQIFIDRSGRPLVALTKPPIALTLNLRGKDVNHRLNGNLIVAPAALSEHLLEMVAEGEIAPQDAIDKFEAELDRINSRSN